MKKPLTITIALAVLILTAACGETAQTAETASPVAAAETASREIGFSGVIQSVEGNTVTVKTEDGTEKTFTVTDSTKYSVEMGEMPFGENGTALERPTGDMGQPNGTAPERPTGDMGQPNGEPPERPTGDMGQPNGEPPERPTGENGMQPGAEMLTAGAEVTVTLSEDGTAAEVQLSMNAQSMGNFGGRLPQE